MKPFFKLTFTKEGHDALMKLARKSGGSSARDAIHKSCAVLEYILDHQAAGNTIVIESPDGSRETFKLK